MISTSSDLMALAQQTTVKKGARRRGDRGGDPTCVFVDGISGSSKGGGMIGVGGRTVGCRREGQWVAGEKSGNCGGVRQCVYTDGGTPAHSHRPVTSNLTQRRQTIARFCRPPVGLSSSPPSFVGEFSSSALLTDRIRPSRSSYFQPRKNDGEATEGSDELDLYF
ncbi:gibberellin 2-oxidase 6 [Striga asiatica]|uniref:Gibberellin 2-oxidase 6 n=1 Tax=Striga asiatica TaxID=4170 RepID=A0A5A7P681_STRAF|nr:gibberellin 2-oxidase 6 [Striga asiatica]